MFVEENACWRGNFRVIRSGERSSVISDDAIPRAATAVGDEGCTSVELLYVVDSVILIWF